MTLLYELIFAHNESNANKTNDKKEKGKKKKTAKSTETFSANLPQKKLPNFIGIQ
jgi:hypothetical protein